MNTFLITSINQLVHMHIPYAAFLHSIGGMACHYYSIEAIRVSMKTFSALGASLFFIVISAKTNLVAVFPFQRHRNKARGLVSTLSFWGDFDIYAHNVNQKLLIGGYRPDAVDLAASFLKNECRDLWDSIDLRRVRSQEDNLNYFISKFQDVDTEPSGVKSYFFESNVDLNEHLGKRKLANIRLGARNLSKAFEESDLRIKETIDSDDFNIIKRIHTDRQYFKIDGGSSRSAFFDNEIESNYIKQLFRFWSSSGSVRYYSLCADDNVIAVAIFHHSLEESYIFLTAMDSAYKRYQPGRVLWHEAFSHEINECGVSRIHLGWGSSKFKEDFASVACETIDVTIVSEKWKSKAKLSLIKNFKAIKATLNNSPA
jgi:hypothetical protein